MTTFTNHRPPMTYWTSADRVQSTYERLTWRYGSARALAIVRGEDPEANADIEAWRRFIGRARP